MQIVDASTIDLDKVIADLDGFFKFQSILYLRKLGLPVLDGIILTQWNDATRRELLTYCRKRRWSAVLLRHDKKPETPPYPMGGYLISTKDIQVEVLKYFDLGRIVFLMEPCCQFDNSYNISALFENDNRMTIEIVGPGFDASDLQRGQASPHEVVQVDETLRGNSFTLSELGFARIAMTTFIVDQKSYLSSVKQRYIKIARRLKDLGILSFEENNKTESELVSIAKSYLKKNGHRALFLNEKEYTPIPPNCLLNVYSFLQDLPKKIEYEVKHGFPFVVSSSYVQEGKKLVFWDIVWSKLKYSLSAA